VETATFNYVTYIAAPPERVWEAFMDNEQVKDWWVRHRNVSDWKAGSRWEHQDYDDASIVDLAGEVIECVAPERLVLSWAFVPDLSDPAKTSRVTFCLHPFLGATRLAVTHEGLEPDSPMLHGVKQGWPVVLSSLKTLLETGHAMPMTMRRWNAPPE
jgi:uncharacterized protein YndB with AHSA1/START domain